MYVICDKCEDVYSIFECKKVWSNDHKKRYPKYICDCCRNVTPALSMPKNEEICAI